MLVCTLSLLTLGFSLWGGDVDNDVASAVAAGTVSSLVVSGGFVQAMARRALFYIGTREAVLAASTCRRWTLGAAAALIAIGAAGLAGNAAVHWMPFPLAATTVSFHLSLGMLWIACGLLYMVELNGWIVGATAAGIATVGLLYRLFGYDLIPSQLAGIWTATALAAFKGASWFEARGGRRRLGQGDWLRSGAGQSLSRELYLAGPYFAYGLLYYLFLFGDRLIAWTAHTNASALPIQFRGDYETALDLAMIAFVLQVGWVHASLVAYQRELARGQARFQINEAPRFNAMLTRFYVRRLGLFAAFGVASSLLVYWIVNMLGLLPFPAMRPVLQTALVAYPLVVWGLWNTSLLFNLSRPAPVIGAAGAGLCTSITLGYLLSRVGGYEAAIFGFLIGSFAFGAFTGIGVMRALRTLDHYHFASAL
jgi:hypothetical protein